MLAALSSTGQQAAALSACYQTIESIKQLFGFSLKSSWPSGAGLVLVFRVCLLLGARGQACLCVTCVSAYNLV